MADSSFIIDILANVEKSVASIKGLSASVDKEVKTINKTFDSVSKFAISALAAIGVGFSLKAAIDEAAEFEQDINQLRISLGATGQATDKTVESFKDYAQVLQETTKFSDNAVLQTSALIQNIAQLGQKDLKQATKAALDLSAALGIDVATAASLVAKAANGNVSALKRYGIEIRQGRDDAQSLANTLSVLESRFGGASEKSVNTFAGAIAQLKNAAADSLKTFGAFITQSPEVIQAIQIITQGFVKLTKVIADNEGIVQRSVTAFANFIKSVDGRAQVYAEIEKSIKQNTQSQRDLGAQVDENIQAAKAFRVARLEAEKTAEITAKKVREQLETNTIDGLKTIEGELKNAGKSQIQILIDNRERQLQVISDGQKLGLVPVQEANKLRLDSQRKFESELDKILATSKEKKKQDEERAQKELEQARSRQGAIASGFINNIQQGAAGVVNAMQSLTALAVDTLLPGFGGVAATLLGFLAQGPDAVKAQIQAFIDNIPLIIDNIVLAIPAVIDALAANSGKIAVALSLAMPVVATRLAIELVKQTPTIAKSFVDSLVAEAGRLITAIADGVKQAISQATGLGGGGGPLGALGGVGGSIAGIGKKLKFASGGVVPQGFPNDSFPIMAQSGEGIVPNDTMRRLDQYLMRADGAASSSGGGGTTIIKLVVGEQELANVLLNLNRQGFRV